MHRDTLTKKTIQVGDMVRCIKCPQPHSTNSDWPGVGWVKDKEFKVERITDGVDPILWPVGSVGVYSSAVEIIEMEWDL